MDEKKMAEEFANIYKAIGSNCESLIGTDRDLGKVVKQMEAHRSVINELVDVTNNHADHMTQYRNAIKEIEKVVNNHIDNYNRNIRIANAEHRKLVRYCTKQNVAILAGIAGFLYLYKKIQKLEEATKKE